MSFFKKILGSLFANTSEQSGPNESQYLPEKELPIDEEFTFNFKSNGGKFLYCETETEVQDTFVSILMENDWFESEAITFESNLIPMLRDNRIHYNQPKNPLFLLTTCESLIADEGSILFSSKQVSHLKPLELPNNIVVIATTSQITRSKSDGLREIKKKYQTVFPTNITTFKCFEPTKEDHFLNYGSTPKNLYLLLLEDL
ncbi:lactate utilization protein B/C [Flavobacterium sp. HSC-61S13]|uniref:lactate utilization protein B/C n=1 Tax=Flavobacterium sp. HSC-61S13 TaxID=2910963 RepID=UPI00209E0851|nr:lactate utilization protein B/C [Flavobacterium sp. HSC-61S13]MCP1995753.1 hypothetical protein [Flavobacterium sp. HSC-61S13]